MVIGRRGSPRHGTAGTQNGHFVDKSEPSPRCQGQRSVPVQSACKERYPANEITAARYDIPRKQTAAINKGGTLQITGGLQGSKDIRHFREVTSRPNISCTIYL